MRTQVIRNLILLLPLSLMSPAIAPAMDSETDTVMTESISQKISEQHLKLKNIQAKAIDLLEANADDSQYFELRTQARKARAEIRNLDIEWKRISQPKHDQQDQDSMWHMPDSTISNLVVEFGNPEFVYIIPTDIQENRLSIVGNVSIPRQQWESMFEWVLQANGIGIRQVNQYCKQLFVASQFISSFSVITDKLEDLFIFDDQTKVCFIIDCKTADTKYIASSLDKLLNNSSIQVKDVCGKLGIVATVQDTKQAVRVCEFLIEACEDSKNIIVPVTKMSATEMEKVLKLIMGNTSEQHPHFGFPITGSDTENLGLKIISIGSPQTAILISGPNESVDRAANIVKSLEQQIKGAGSKEIIWYQVKHTNPEELAKTLSNVCKLFSTSGILPTYADTDFSSAETEEAKRNIGGIAPLVVPGGLAEVKNYNTDIKNYNENVVVDVNTGTIIMAVSSEMSEHIMEIIERLDAPEKMVKINFILFEKKLSERTEMGINKLSINEDTSDKATYGFKFPVSATSSGEVGISSFFLSSGHDLLNVPPFDIAYNFLISQENTHVNANPSVLTLNGKSAAINLVEETSVNVGQTSVPSTGSAIIQDSFVRAQYGIKIKVKPIIHEDGNQRYISLDCDLTFETNKNLKNSRPEVRTRNLKNICRVYDNETVVIGGLRQKESEHKRGSIPLVGELPFISTLFGYKSLADRMTETFVLIRPQIIDSPAEKIKNLQIEEMQKRPGDLPEILKKYEEAKRNRERRKACQSLRFLYRS